jgi:hypothetical protein
LPDLCSRVGLHGGQDVAEDVAEVGLQDACFEIEAFKS